MSVSQEAAGKLEKARFGELKVCLLHGSVVGFCRVVRSDRFAVEVLEVVGAIVVPGWVKIGVKKFEGVFVIVVKVCSKFS